jgi:hypothetical protein
MTDNQHGLISLCPHAGCAFRCCDFQQGNYIVLYPGELEDAIEGGRSIGHLEIFDRNYHGGQRARCTAADGSTCDSGYKPLDCASYPYFPAITESGEPTTLLKGDKCPLTEELTTAHARWVLETWVRLADERSDIYEWLTKVLLVGYSLANRPSSPERYT